MKVIGIVILVIVLLLVLLIGGLLLFISKIPAVLEDYTETVETGGEIEAKYLAMGDHEVEYFESVAFSSFEKYEIYYPKDIEEMDEPLPVVVFVNGTGVKGSKYPALQQHLASWGFITIATEEEYAWNGFSAEMCVRYAMQLNEWEGEVNEGENFFYGKIDLDHIGVTGHSQGGFGVVNAITDQKHSDIYKAAVSLSCSDTTIVSAFQWEADSTLIQTPTMIIGSTGPMDTQIASLEGVLWRGCRDIGKLALSGSAGERRSGRSKRSCG